jgi:hypothetical protein
MGLSGLKLEVWPTFSWRKTEFNSIRRGLTLLFVGALEPASLRSPTPSVAGLKERVFAGRSYWRGRNYHGYH